MSSTNSSITFAIFVIFIALSKTAYQSNLTSCSTLNRTNYDNGLTEIQCHTKTRLHNITYVWNIDRFDLHRPADSGETTIKSSLFSSATYDEVKCRLILYPRNQTSDTIGLRLFCYPNSLETPIRARYSIDFLDIEGNLINTYSQCWFKTFKDNWGWENIPINEVLPSDNILRIVCKIAICEFTTDEFHLNRTDITENSENNHEQNIVSTNKNSENSDVVLILSKTGKEYPTNKTILAAGCPVFAAMFNASFKENNKKIDRVNITEIESEQVFDEILRYIYTGECENIENSTCDLLVAAQKYKLDGLKTSCLKKIKNNLTVENAVDTLVFADKYGIGELKSNVITFIAANYAKVSSTSDWKQIIKTNGEFVHEVCERLSIFLRK